MSKLKMVTLTGADDSTNPNELIKLSEEFPFVEWGILVGTGYGGRFPPPGWFRKLHSSIIDSTTKSCLSLHLCGSRLESLLLSGLLLSNEPLDYFQRIQLNFHGEKVLEKEVENIAKCSILSEFQIIVQMDGINNWVLDKLLESGLDAAGLFDESHGAGVLPPKWPLGKPHWKVGYAGGLGPENILEQLKRIQEVSIVDYWIDMETKIRTDGKFDLGKCQTVLEICRDFIASQSV